MGVVRHEEADEVRKMLQAKPVVRGSRTLFEVKNLYLASFPRNERISFGALLRKSKKSDIQFFGFYDGDLFVGIAYLLYFPGLVFVLYLAVNPNIQSKGYGTHILQHIDGMHPDNRIALDIEAVEDSADNYDQRQKRRLFYLKNGFESSGLGVIDKDVNYEVLVKNGCITAEELIAAQKRISGWLSYRLFGPRVVRLKQDNGVK